MSKKLTTEEFIDKAKEVHGDKYDYSKSVYVDAKTKICIICHEKDELGKEHGEFYQIPYNHLRGENCPNCSNRTKITTEIFIARSKKVHGDKYDYSKSVYVDPKTPVQIICPEHGEFSQNPYGHMKGRGCKECSIVSGSEKRTKTTEDFIKMATLIHGNRYDYSKTEYLGTDYKLRIICREHGEFLQYPSNHLKGCGCYTCGRNDSANKQKSSLEEFISRAKEVHGDKYDYSKVEYINSSTNVTIICPKHGEFEQKPYNHLIGNGCQYCAGNVKLSDEEFISKAKEVHGNKYDYSKVEYVNNRIPVIIICPEHGEFLQAPDKHIGGHGCEKCGRISIANKKRSSKEEFIEKAIKVHGNKYDYSKVEYVANNIPVCIICPEHGEFLQSPSSHLNGCGCARCSRPHSGLTKDEFVAEAKKIHGNKYDYSKVEFTTTKDVVCIICPKHGEFFQSVDNHMRGNGCPTCNESLLEKIISQVLANNNVAFSRQKRFDWLKDKKRMPLDFFLPEYNIAIECQGIQHFKVVDRFGGEEGLSDRIHKDTLKRQLCEEHGIKVLYYSNLGIDYPYQVYEDKEELLKAILSA